MISSTHHTVQLPSAVCEQTIVHVSFHHVLRYKMKLQCTCMIVLGEVVRYRGRKEERKTVAINDTDLSGDARKEVGQKGR